MLYTVTLTVGFASVSGIMNQIISALGVSEKVFEIMDEEVTINTGSHSFEINSNDVVV